MQSNTKAVLPRFVELGTERISKLIALLTTHKVSCRKTLILYDDNTVHIGGHDIVTTFRKTGISVLGDAVENSDHANLDRIKSVIEKHTPDLVIGFGGGKVLDVAKLAAAEYHTRFISIPTTLSNDGIASPVSVIKDAHNIPISHITIPPYGVIIDTDVVKQAPRRHRMAGVGDLLSNLSAVFDARLAHEKKAEAIDTHSLALAEAGGLNLLELNSDDISSDVFLRNLAQGLIKSGFAMCISGTSRPASGSEHKISHSIDHYFPPSKALHGEQVGIAAIFTMSLQNNVSRHRVSKFYERIGFPTKISYLGLNPDEFINVVRHATEIRPERYTILEDTEPTGRDIRRVLKEAQL